ncbi:diacylglycerol kinase [Denitromonas sp.]|uniref:diacylglycerol kinase n=1 Tax=Denitromonas sp. TaxID=2734609 RepID=UPI003A85DB07
MADNDGVPAPRATGIARIINAFRYSCAGLAAAFRHEAALRQECVLAMVLIPAALLSAADGVGKAMMVGSVLLVMVVELINSAIEAVVDRVSQARHPLAKRAKDIGSAAVLLALLNLVAVWALVLLA